MQAVGFRILAGDVEVGRADVFADRRMMDDHVAHPIERGILTDASNEIQCWFNRVHDLRGACQQYREISYVRSNVYADHIRRDKRFKQRDGLGFFWLAEYELMFGFGKSGRSEP